MNKIFLTLVLASVMRPACVSAQEYINNRPPLAQKEYMELPLGSIRAEGWIKEQLMRARDGMTGHMDSIYTSVMGPGNAWLGGEGDAWERGPYWIDGLLPLAYILDDKDLKAKVQPWIEHTLASLKPDGYFGPGTDRPDKDGMQRGLTHDWWPKMVMLKVLQQYYSATGDERVTDMMTRYFRYQLEHLPETPLDHWTEWARERGGENLMMVHWLYNITGESFLLDLAELIHSQTRDWTGEFLYSDAVARQHSYHCVNLAMGFKEPVIWYQQSRNPEHLQAVYKAVEKMRHSTALPTGLWAGDEMMRFGRPTAGSELCTAVEMMFSLEKIIGITGDMRWADHLERIAYNVLYDYRRRSKTACDIDDVPGVRSRHETADSNLKMDLYDALSRLNDNERSCISLQLIDGYPINRISEITGMAEGTVKSHIFRGKKKLSEYLKHNGYD